MNYLEKQLKNEKKEIIPSYDIKMEFERKIDDNFNEFIKNKNLQTKPIFYPFNDLKGNYFVSFLNYKNYCNKR